MKTQELAENAELCNYELSRGGIGFAIEALSYLHELLRGLRALLC